MEKILNTLSTEMLIGFIAILVGGYVFLIKYFAPKIIKNIKETYG